MKLIYPMRSDYLKKLRSGWLQTKRILARFQARYATITELVDGYVRSSMTRRIPTEIQLASSSGADDKNRIAQRHEFLCPRLAES